MKLGEVTEQWAAQHRLEVKKSTMLTYLLQIKKYILPELGEVEVETVNKKTIQPFVFELLNKGLSIKSVKDVIITLRMVLRYAAEELDLPVPTQFKLKYPTRDGGERSRRIETYTEAEQQRLADWIMENPSPKNYGILLTLCTGMRIGEVCGLRFEDIDTAKNVIHVRRTIERCYDMSGPDIIRGDRVYLGKSVVIISEPKTVNSVRDIPLLPKMRKILADYAKVAKPDYYFLTMSEEPTEPRTYRNHYGLVLKKAGLRYLKFHGLRHTFATKMVANKVDVKTIASILGHADVSTTLNLYVHPSDDERQTAVKRVFRHMI